VDQLQRIAGRPDDPLHDIEVRSRVLDRPKHDHAASGRLGVAGGMETPNAREGDLELAAVAGFVHEEEIADQ
jgi:hypothetical protein